MKVLVSHYKSSHYLSKEGQRQSLFSGRREGRRAGIQAKGGEPCCKALASRQVTERREGAGQRQKHSQERREKERKWKDKHSSF